MCAWKTSSLKLGSVFMCASLISACKAEGPEMEVTAYRNQQVMVQSKDNNKFIIKGIRLNRGSIKPAWVEFLSSHDYLKNPDFSVDSSLLVLIAWQTNAQHLRHEDAVSECKSFANLRTKVVEVGTVTKGGFKLFVCIAEPELKFGQSFKPNPPDLSSSINGFLNLYQKLPHQKDPIIEVEVVTDRGSRFFTFK